MLAFIRLEQNKEVNEYRDNVRRLLVLLTLFF